VSLRANIASVLHLSHRKYLGMLLASSIPLAGLQVQQVVQARNQMLPGSGLAFESFRWVPISYVGLVFPQAAYGPDA
jgi:hypothetical protein